MTSPIVTQITEHEIHIDLGPHGFMLYREDMRDPLVDLRFTLLPEVSEAIRDALQTLNEWEDTDAMKETIESLSFDL